MSDEHAYVEESGHDQGGEEISGGAKGAKKKLDPGFKRNLMIIGGAVLAMVVVIAIVVFGAKAKIDGAKDRGPGTIIPKATTTGGGSQTQLTPEDEARMGRVQTKESDTARERKDTYIPKDMPLKPEDIKTPDAQNNGPGKGYNYKTGDNQGGQVNQVDAQRETLIKKGIELQLGSLLSKAEAPPTQSATFYTPPGGAAPVAAVAPSGAASSASASAASVTLIGGLKIAGGRLVSPLDTAKTEFISAVIDSGPLEGAYLVGKGKMVGEEGVLMTFTRMTVAGEDYAVNVTGLDNGTSSDAMNADVDRKLLSRHVMPVFFATVAAYMQAIARPSQTVVVTSGGGAQVVTPGAAGREAVATGIAAGATKAGAAFGAEKSTAFLPANTGIGLLFNEAVVKKVKK